MKAKVVQRDGEKDAKAGPGGDAKDKPPSLEDRVATLEKQQASTNLDAQWRGTFGKRLSGYRQSIYMLTAGFQTAVQGFNGAHTKQAQAEALKDMVFASILNVAAAGLAQPFLTAGLGALGPRIKDLTAAVEAIENPLVQAAQGVTQTGGQAVSNARQAGAPTAQGGPSGAGGVAGPGGGGGDPMLFLTQNLAEVEKHNQAIEQAFTNRATKASTMTPDQWKAWDVKAQTQIYSDLLAGIDAIALPDPEKIESGQTLAVKIELYYWAAWIKQNTGQGSYGTSGTPTASGLNVGSQLATRMKSLGLESLAQVTFDTTSWIFMDHKPEPPGFEQNLLNWASGWSQKLVKG
jgi:hypothetical protein